MDMFDYFKKIQDSMIKSFNKSISSKYKRPSCEISQGKDSLSIKIDLPGMVKKDVILNITHDYLKILAEKKSRTKRGYKMEEKYLGFRRIIPLPPGLVTDKTNAKFSKDKLTIKIPKIKIGKIKVK